MRGIYVRKGDLRAMLEEELARAPTAEEYEAWRSYVESDVYEWLRDNIRAFRDTDAYGKMTKEEA